MNKAVEHGADEARDGIQQCLTNYALGLTYDDLPSETIHAAKIRVIDTFGALIGGFFDEPSRVSRDIAAEVPNPSGATVVGTRMKTSPDMAAFANATTSRSAEMNDVAHKPGGRNGHPSDVVLPIFAVAEQCKADGREFITGVVLGYEIYLRLAEAISFPAFDLTNFGCVASAVAAGKLLSLPAPQLLECISMATVANIALTQSRVAPLTMWKAVASGRAGQAGVFAATSARKGLKGPRLPFEGKHGWCNHVAQKQFSLDVMGGKGVAYRVHDSVIKPRAACFLTLAPILAAEQIVSAIGAGIENVRHVRVETYEQSRAHCGVGAHWWNPDSRETADHSIPYGIAVALMDGKVTPHSFDDAHLRDPALRRFLSKVEVVENEEFTDLYNRWPVQHHAKVTVTTNSGEQFVGETGGKHGDLADGWSNAKIEGKFREITADIIGTKRAGDILDCLWNLEHVDDISTIPPMFALN